jgi:hypothetical protein
MAELPADNELLSFTLNDPDLEQHRDFLRSARRQARQDFIGAHVAELEWSTPSVDSEHAGLTQEAANAAAAARQRKENVRRRYAELDRILAGVPVPKKEDASKAAAREASKQ